MEPLTIHTKHTYPLRPTPGQLDDNCLVSVDRSGMNFYTKAIDLLGIRKGDEILFAQSYKATYMAVVSNDYRTGYSVQNNPTSTLAPLRVGRHAIGSVRLEPGLYYIDEAPTFDRDTKLDWYKLVLIKAKG